MTNLGSLSHITIHFKLFLPLMIKMANRAIGPIKIFWIIFIKEAVLTPVFKPDGSFKIDAEATTAPVVSTNPPIQAPVIVSLIIII